MCLFGDIQSFFLYQLVYFVGCQVFKFVPGSQTSFSKQGFVDIFSGFGIIVALFTLRFLVGLGLGAELPVASTLVSEFAPRRMRGRVVVALEAFWAVGWIGAALLGYLLVPASPDGWRWALAVGIVPVAAQLDLKAFATAVGAKKATMAKPADAARSSGYVVGGISPLGQRTHHKTVLDESALQYDEILLSGGKRGFSVGVNPNDLLKVLDAVAAPIGTW